MARLGESFEDMIARDLGINRTCNSGAKWGDGDLHHPQFYLEAKDRGVDAFSLPHDDYLKILSQMRDHGKQLWAYFVQNKRGESVVVIPYDLFVALYGQPIEYECPHCGGEIEVEV